MATAEKAEKQQHEEEPSCVDTCMDVVPYSGGQVLCLDWEADSTWCLEIMTLVKRYMQAQLQMAWCSTLGGAHSSLGDEYQSHAKLAGVISEKQFGLAVALGDPMMGCRSKVYLALSLMQQGQYRKAGKIIRVQYKFAKGKQGRQDDKLELLCLAAWDKLTALRQQKAIL